jgi:hypothetical protein
MVFLHIPAQHPGWGFFLLPAEPSLLSTTRRSLRRHTRARTRRARSSILAPTSSRAFIVGDPYVRDLHQLGSGELVAVRRYREAEPAPLHVPAGSRVLASRRCQQ